MCHAPATVIHLQFTFRYCICGHKIFAAWSQHAAVVSWVLSRLTGGASAVVSSTLPLPHCLPTSLIDVLSCVAVWQLQTYVQLSPLHGVHSPSAAVSVLHYSPPAIWLRLCFRSGKYDNFRQRFPQMRGSYMQHFGAYGFRGLGVNISYDFTGKYQFGKVFLALLKYRYYI